MADSYFKTEAIVYPSSIPSLSEELHRETKQYSKYSLVCMGTLNYCVALPISNLLNQSLTTIFQLGLIG